MMSGSTDELEWAKEEPPPPPPPAPSPPPWYQRPVGVVQGLIGFASLVVLVVIIASVFRSCDDRETKLKREAYTWSQQYVRRQLLDPDKAVFPPYPDDAVDISMDEKEERFVVRARIEVESPSSVRMYHTYTVELLRHRAGLQWDLVDIEIR